MLLLSNKEFHNFSNYFKKYYGIDLTQKKSLIEGRLYSVVLKNGYRSLSEYLEDIFNDPYGDNAKELISRLTTNYTYFYREALHFDFLNKAILPELVSKEERDLRVWSAGCATGEEAYTIAMTFAEFFGKRKFMYDTQVLATDISVKALEKAKAGRYPSESLEELPAAWKRKYFNKTDSDTWEISGRIKDDVIFRAFNLMDEEYPFKRKFHVIFCRNVMIYFDRGTRLKIVKKLYEHTEDGGYLFIGQSESLNKFETSFQYIKPSIYRKVQS